MAKFIILALLLLNGSAYAEGNIVDLNIGGNSVKVTIEQISVQGSVYGTIIGNGHQVTIDQRGEHTATINLTNAGGASTVTLIQSGIIGQAYSIQQSCATLSGCSVSVIQGQ